MCRRSAAVAVNHGDSLRKLGFIHFVWTWKVQAAHIHWQFIEVYGDDVMSGQQVAKWCCAFAPCRDSVMNDNQSGHQSSYMTCQYCTCWGTYSGRCGTLRCMSADLGLCCGTVQHIVVDVFQYCKVCAIWVVCVMDDIKVARVMTFLTFLRCYAGLKQLTVLSLFGDETWIHHFMPTSQWSTLELRQPGLPIKRELWSNPICQQSAGHCLLGLVLLVDFLEHGHS